MNKLKFSEQIKFYLQWCNDNKKQPNQISTLNEYLNEIQVLERNCY